MKVNLAELQESIADALGVDNTVKDIIGGMKATRTPSGLGKKPKEYKITQSNFLLWLKLYVATQSGATSQQMADRIIAGFEETSGETIPDVKRRAYFNPVSTVNKNLEALGVKSLIVAMPKFGDGTRVSSTVTSIASEDFGLAELLDSLA